MEHVTRAPAPVPAPAPAPRCSPLAQVSLELARLRLAVRLPRLRLPRLRRQPGHQRRTEEVSQEVRRAQEVRSRREEVRRRPSVSSDEDTEAVATCVARLPRVARSQVAGVRRVKVSRDPSFTSGDWIKEFNARCRVAPPSTLPQHSDQRGRHPSSSPEAEAEEESVFYANVPSTTSTPLSCRILPLNRLGDHDLGEEPQLRGRSLADISGVKIYDTVEARPVYQAQVARPGSQPRYCGAGLGSDGALSSSSGSEAEYETVQFPSQRQHHTTPSTLARPPRTLKYSCR